MLEIISDKNSTYLSYVKDDPVRPEIPESFRVSNNRFITALVEDDSTPLAMLCISIQNEVPKAVEELIDDIDGTIAIFYTIWSYAPGSAVKLLLDTVDHIKKTFPAVTRFVTLSPQTEMARRFHLKNGACVYRENESSVNYEYKI